MNCRASMWRDIKKLKEKSKVLDNACVVYSMWEGYATQDELTMKFLEEMKKLNIPVLPNLHVSGHADYLTIQKIISMTRPKAIIPIHTENKEGIKQYTNNAVILEDGETYEL